MRYAASWRGAIVFVGMALLAACVNVEETKNPVSDSLAGIGASVPADKRSRSVELSRHQFDDIPVPEGFFLRNHRNESFSYAFNGRRIGRFVYWGFGKRGELLQHFQSMMPKKPYDWTRAGAGVKAVSDRLVFEKPGERCVITLEPVPNNLRDEFLITISVEST